MFRKPIANTLEICKKFNLNDFLIPESLIFEKKSSYNSQQNRKNLSGNSNIPFSEKNEAKAYKSIPNPEINCSKIEV
jgi:hypothetical protein